ncbi:hypothetical protein ISCGN_025396 [Ixodes scapularis]
MLGSVVGGALQTPNASPFIMGSKQNQKPDRALKRARTEVLYHPAKSPELFKFPKFLVLHSEAEKPLAKLSPFLVSKVLEGVVGTNFNAKKMASGDLLVEINTKQQSDALLALNSVSDYKVSVTPHRKLNTIQGVISENDLLETSQEELVEGLVSQGVVGARRITLRRDGVERKTRHIILTFDSTTLPETVKAGYLQCRVRPYVPNPQRCFKCQRFGHGSRNCRGRNTCAKCSSKEHATDACDNEPHCANCSGNHPAYSRSCPMWKDEKEVLKLKVTENISYVEAKKRFAFVSKGSYAEAVRRGPARPVVSMGTQTSLDDLHLPSRSPSKPPNRKVNAALPASTPEQGTMSPAQPASSTSRGRGLPPHTSAPQRKPGEVPRQSTSRVQLPAAADEPMDEGGSRSDEEALLSRSESTPSASGDSNRRQNPSKKQSAPRVKIDFKP